MNSGEIMDDLPTARALAEKIVDRVNVYGRCHSLRYANEERLIGAFTNHVIVLNNEIERLREALRECAKACYLDEYENEFKPTTEAMVARAALGDIKSVDKKWPE